MASIRWSLAMRFCAAAGAVTLAAAVLAAIAALVEGHAPQPRAVAELAVPLGACLGAAWTLSAWRAEGGDIALAALGARPASTVWLLLALAAPLLAWAPGAARDASAWSLSAEPAALTVQSPGGTTRYVWGPDGAVRQQAGAQDAQFRSLPAPGAYAREASPARWPLVVGRVALLMIALFALAALVDAPSTTPTLLAAALAFGGGHALARLLAAS